MYWIETERGAYTANEAAVIRTHFMQNLIPLIDQIDPLRVFGRVAVVKGLLIEAKGGLTQLEVGARCEIVRRHEAPLPV